mgnify:CR=1 FL=1
MTELSLLKTLMDKEFYELHKGIRCQDKIFTKDVRKVKQVLDYAMETYDQGISLADLEALFYATNKTLTTSNKEQYKKIFQKIANSSALNKEVANEVISKMFQQVVGEEVANIGYAFVNGTQNSLEPLRKIVEDYQDDFTPNLKIEFEDMSIETLLKANAEETQWKFNIPTLRRNVEGVSGGHFIVLGARPNTGKTSFHASLVMGPNGFADQGAKVIVLCNEETPTRVGHRYLTCAVGTDANGIRKDKATHLARYKAKSTHLKFKDSTEKDMSWVESVCKYYKPDIVMLDMGDKFTSTANGVSIHEVLKQNVMYARQIAKQQECAVFYMSQLSAEAEGRVVLNQSMMEGSKTGKAAEADLMLLLARNPPTENQTEEDTHRHIINAKNKLTGWHGMVTCEFDYKTPLFSA